jgi:hypothetical protein
MKLKDLLPLRLTEDSIEQAIAAHKYAADMLKNAKEKKLDSINYWSDKLNNAKDRVKTLKNKGEVETADTDSKANEILNKANQSLQSSFKNAGVKKHAKIFLQQLGKHLTFKKVAEEAKEVFELVAKPIHKASKLLINNPKEAIKDGYESSKNFLKRSVFAIKNVGQVANNVIDMTSDFKNKHNFKFTDEEKQLMKSDPDKFKDKLMKRLTPQEEKDVTTLAKVAATTAFLTICGTYIGHAVHVAGATSEILTAEVGNSLVHGLMTGGSEIMKSHLIASVRDSAFTTLIIAGSLELSHPKHESIDDNDIISRHGQLSLQLEPFIVLFTDSDMQKELINNYTQLLQENIK